MSFHWRTFPGQFRHPMAPLPADNGSYDWSDLGHPDRNPFSVKLPLPPPFMDKEADVEASVEGKFGYVPIQLGRA